MAAADFDSQKALTELSCFGALVVAGSKPGTIEIPKYQLSESTFEDLVEKVAKTNDKSAIVGLCCALYTISNINFKNFSEEDRAKYRSTALKFCVGHSDEKTIRSILKTLDSIQGMSDDGWPELQAFLFNQKDHNNDYLRGYAISSLNFIQEPAFAIKNKDKILRTVAFLLSSDLPIPKHSILLLIPLTDTNADELSSNALIDSIWQTAISSTNDSEIFKTVCPALHQLAESEDFRKLTSAPITAIIAAYQDKSKPVPERIKAVAPVIQLLPFISDDALQNFLSTTIELLKTSLMEALPLIDIIEDTDLDLLTENNAVLISASIQVELDSGSKPAALVLFAPFMNQIIEFFPELEAKLRAQIVESLQSSGREAFVGCFALRHLVSRMTEKDSKMLTELFPHLTSDDEALRTEAKKTIKELLESSVYSDEDTGKEILSHFAQFSNNLDLYSKIATHFLENSTDAGLTICEPFYDFALPLLSQKRSNAENALALRIFSSLSEIGPEYVEEKIEDTIPVALHLIKDCDVSYWAPATEFLSAMSDAFPNETRDRAISIMPSLQKVVSHEISCDEQMRRSIAISASEIVAAYDLRDVAADLCSVALTDLVSDKEKVSKGASEMLYTMSKILLPQTATEVFDKIAEFINNSSSNTNTLLSTLKRLIKKYKIDRVKAETFVKALFEGKIKAVGQIENIDDPETSVFSLLKQFVIRYKNLSVPFCNQIVEAISFIDPLVLPQALSPIETAIEMSLLEESTIAKLLKTLMSLLNEENCDIVSLLPPLISIKRSKPEAIDNNEIMKTLDKIWENCDDEEEVEEASAIAMFSVELAELSEDGAGIDLNLLKELVDILPTNEEYLDLEHVINSAIKISEKGWSQSIKEPILLLFARILLMKKADIEKYEVSSNSLQELRKRFKSIFKEDKKYEAVLKEAFSSSKVKLGALSALLK